MDNRQRHRLGSELFTHGSPVPPIDVETVSGSLQSISVDISMLDLLAIGATNSGWIDKSIILAAGSIPLFVMVRNKGVLPTTSIGTINQLVFGIAPVGNTGPLANAYDDDFEIEGSRDGGSNNEVAGTLKANFPYEDGANFNVRALLVGSDGADFSTLLGGGDGYTLTVIYFDPSVEAEAGHPIVMKKAVVDIDQIKALGNVSTAKLFDFSVTNGVGVLQVIGRNLDADITSSVADVVGLSLDVKASGQSSIGLVAVNLYINGVRAINAPAIGSGYSPTRFPYDAAATYDVELTITGDEGEEEAPNPPVKFNSINGGNGIEVIIIYADFVSDNAGVGVHSLTEQISIADFNNLGAVREANVDFADPLPANAIPLQRYSKNLGEQISSYAGSLANLEDSIAVASGRTQQISRGSQLSLLQNAGNRGQDAFGRQSSWSQDDWPYDLGATYASRFIITGDAEVDFSNLIGNAGVEHKILYFEQLNAPQTVTIEYVDSSSTAPGDIPSTVNRNVVIHTSNGAPLEQEVTANAFRKGGNAVDGLDFDFTDPFAITFPVGSLDGSTQPVTVDILGANSQPFVNLVLSLKDVVNANAIGNTDHNLILLGGGGV